MSIDLQGYLTLQQKRVEEQLRDYMQAMEGPSALYEAMNYSLMAGGKRIRPIFLLAVITALEGDQELGLPAACALEMIHTYSLIHDDLPAMDNDDYRRGKLTCHKVYGEAMAILAGDALLTHAFYVLSSQYDSKLEASIVVQLMKELSYQAGSKGMVGGQVADVLGEGKLLSLQELLYIHEHKTADLLTCAIRMGGLIGGASPEQLQQLSHFAKQIGIAFQIQDDILDEVGDEQKLGKKVGSDRLNDKVTFVSLLGLEKAKQELSRHIDEAKQALYKADVKDQILHSLADYMIQRES